MLCVWNYYEMPKLLRASVVDAAFFFPAIFVGLHLSGFGSPVGGDVTFKSDVFWRMLLILAIFEVCATLNRSKAQDNFSQQVTAAVQAFSLTLALLGVFSAASSHRVINTDFLFIGGALGLQSTILGRLAVQNIWRDSRCARVAILGTGDLAITVARELRAKADLGIGLVGFIKEEALESESGFVDGPILGDAASIEDIVREHGVARVIIALENRWGVLPTSALVRLRFEGIAIEDSHSTIADVTGRIPLSTVRPGWFVFTDGFDRSALTLTAKRVVDIVFSAIGLILAVPIIVIASVLIKLESEGPVLYRQTRVGWRGRTFEVLKFRSMRVDAERHGAVWASVGDARATRVGKIIRKYRIDEIPQLANVLKGEMSLVGPRPERPIFVDELRRKIDYYDERHSMRPGLTGWAQVRYPYGASIDDAFRKLEYDLFYLKHVSVLFDLAIMADTVRVVLGGKHGR